MTQSFDQIDSIFTSLGRALLILDSDFRVIQAGKGFDDLVCVGASLQVVGHSIDDFFQAHAYNPALELKRALALGKREEGRRAFLVCPTGHSRLVSITAAPFLPLAPSLLMATACFFLVVRPAEDEDLILHHATLSQGLIARSESMLNIVRRIEALHHSDATVLVTGESGTGKEVVARALHYHSQRKDNPFIAVNCSAFPGGLLENELFGHAKGAYTGAFNSKPGRMEMVGEGTLFLDEIGEMPLAFQVKLLRVIQEREYERLGENTTRHLKARIIAATNVDLKKAIEEGQFREDLYYRLKVIPIHIPPLRERIEDVEVLAKTLLTKIGSRIGRQQVIPTDTMKALQKYSWPGNVRELENSLEYAATFCQGQFIQIEDLPPEICTPILLLDDAEPNKHEASKHDLPFASANAESHEDEERRKLIDALDRNHWNKGKTADYLGNSRATLWRKMKKYNLS